MFHEIRPAKVPDDKTDESSAGLMHIDFKFKNQS